LIALSKQFAINNNGGFMIVLIGGEKGGPGKTTIAINLAAIRTKNIEDLLLIDTDKQPTASYWCSLREDNQINPRVASVQKFEKAVRTETLALKTKYEDIIIDAGGRDSPELRSALLVADKAVFPLRPSQFDLWTLGRMNTLVETAKEFNEKLEAFIVINQASPNPAVKEVEEARELIQEFGNLRLLKTHLCERIAFRRAAIQGMAVTEYKPEDNKAIEEVINLYEEIFNEHA
jgi:chromosome partitioning protein